MSTIVTRSGKGSPLTHNEVDTNFTNLNTDKVEKTAAAITGGTIDNTTIGATTPSTGVFTTLTAQTERLNGTGQNLLLQSQDFTNATWTKGNITAASTSATTDPLGGLTANILTPNGTTDAYCRQTLTPVLSTSYGVSVYAKAGTGSWLRLRALFINNNTTDEAWFNLSTGALGTVQASVSATITSVGNGWYRCALVGSTIATNTASFLDVAVSNADNTRNTTNAQTIYVWGSQSELSSTVGLYVATTSTVVYGTPTLSFSGVAGIGLQSDGSLYHQPAGTGAVQAQATTSSATGGNARGANAVDWSTSRYQNNHVASGLSSVLAGGYAQVVSGSYAGVLTGNQNIATNAYSTIVGGVLNNSGGFAAFIGSGQSNSTAGYYNFVGGGFTNSATSGSAVTTQSGTMNGTTAVTLSGSNASIKVGQYIQGTSIASDTYVSAVSGTSLTLSKVASGSSTSTLSFFTPHGVVVGGGNNQATGSYSFIGGGGDAGTAANRNVASGDWSVVGGGRSNTASGSGSFVGGGGFYAAAGSNTYPNSASGATAAVVGGLNNSASSETSFVGAGQFNTASGAAASIMGGAFGTTRAIIGNSAFPSCLYPIAATQGVSQGALLILGVQTTDATATVLRSNTSAATTTNQVILPNNSAYYFRGEVVSGVTGGGNTKGWTIEGVIKRGANAASTALVGTPTVTSLYADAGAATWTIAVTADTTNGGLAVTFTGQASTTIRTVAQIRTTEMTY